MKRAPLLTGLALAFAATTTQADIIGNFDGLTLDGPTLPGNGQFDAPAAITADFSGLFGGTTGSLVFNLTGLNVTGDATANDSATLTFNVTAAGGNIANPTTGNRIGVAGNDADGISDPTESLTFTFDSGTVTLGDAGINAGVNFIGFRNIDLNGFGAVGEAAVISGGTAADGTFTVGDTLTFATANGLGNASSFTIGAGNATDNFNVEGFGARIEFTGQVPEPGSFALVGLGSLMLLKRRSA